MDRLWSPWRYQYVTRSGSGAACIFCSTPAEQLDDANFILHRGQRNFVLLNRYPYTSGHLLIAPFEHLATLEAADLEIGRAHV